jgi:L-seryl-tRNA(Ser) seleniumtransferase
MLSVPLDELKRRAEALSERLQTNGAFAEVAVAEDVAYVGGGSLPDQPMKTWIVAVTPRDCSDADFAQRLRLGTPAVMARVRDGKIVLDVRTVFPHHLDALVAAVGAAAAGGVGKM